MHKRDKKKKNNILDVSIEQTYVNESIVENATQSSKHILPNEVSSIDIKISSVDANGNKIEVENNINGKIDLQSVADDSGLGLNYLRTLYNEKGYSAEEVYKYLKNYIVENKNNPEALEKTVSLILSEFATIYDNDKNRNKIAQSQVEAMEKILSLKPDEELKNFICTTIHDFVKVTLEECGFKSAVAIGSSTGSERHAILIYQREDGKYVFNNYDVSMVIEASNIKDALREVYKNSGIFESLGYLTLTNGEEYYTEYIQNEETAFGEDIDKRIYNSVTSKDFGLIDKSRIDMSGNVSSIGNTSGKIEGTLAWDKRDTKNNLTLATEYKDSKETSSYLKSESYGLKGNYKFQKAINEKNLLYGEIEGICSITNRTLPKATYEYLKFNNEVVTKKYIDETLELIKGMGFLCNENVNISINVSQDSEKVFDLSANKMMTNSFKSMLGLKTDIINQDDFELTNSTQARFHYNMALEENSGTRDYRLSLEDSIHSSSQFGNVSLKNEFNLGIVGDLFRNLGKQSSKLSPGVKTNLSTEVGYNIENYNLVANGSVYHVATKPAKDWGFKVGLSAIGHLKNSNTTVFGSANYSNENQRLTVGMFNERTENLHIFDAKAGVVLNDKVQLSAGYKREQNVLNATRNKDFISLNAQIRF